MEKRRSAPASGRKVRKERQSKQLTPSAGLGGLGLTLSLIGLALMTLLALQPATPAFASVTICHRTNSATNPYVELTVDEDSVDGDTGNDHGQGDHTTHTGPIATSVAVAQQLKSQKIDWGDIIPAHDNYGGLNWTATGQDILANHCVVPGPDIGVTKSNDDDGNFDVGEQFDWVIEITVSNGPASGTVSDTIPSGFSIDNISSDTPASGSLDCSGDPTVTCTLTDVPDGTYSVNITVTPDGSVCQATNTAEVTTEGGDTNSANDSDSDAVTVNCESTPPDIGVTKSHDSNDDTVTAGGGAFDWTVTITVTDSPASGTIQDVLPSGFTIDSVDDSSSAQIDCSASTTTTLNCTLTDLTPDAGYDVIMSVLPPDGTNPDDCGLRTNTVNVTSGGGANGNNDSDSDSLTVDGCQEPVLPDIGVEKTHSGGDSVDVNGTFTWTVTISVTDGPASGTVQDTLPAGFELTAVDDGGVTGLSCSEDVDNHLLCTLTDVEDGDYDVDLSVTAPDGTPDTECGLQENTASVTQGGGTDPANNSSTDTINVACPDPTISIVKSHSVGANFLTPDETFDWLITILVSNSPDGGVSGTLTDNVPGAFDIQDVTDDSGTISCSISGQQVSCDLLNTTDGTYQVTIRVQAPNGNPDSECQVYSNTASVSATGGLSDSDGDLVELVNCENPPPPTPTPGLTILVGPTATPFPTSTPQPFSEEQGVQATPSPARTAEVEGVQHLPDTGYGPSSQRGSSLLSWLLGASLLTAGVTLLVSSRLVSRKR